jgi:hypothetical protein
MTPKELYAKIVAIINDQITEAEMEQSLFDDNSQLAHVSNTRKFYEGAREYLHTVLRKMAEIREYHESAQSLVFSSNKGMGVNVYSTRDYNGGEQLKKLIDNVIWKKPCSIDIQIDTLNATVIWVDYYGLGCLNDIRSYINSGKMEEAQELFDQCIHEFGNHPALIALQAEFDLKDESDC